MTLETTPPVLPKSDVTLYHLTGALGPSKVNLVDSDGEFRSFRTVPIISKVQLTAELGNSLRATFGRPRTYEGEPMRCFIPRHGLHFEGESTVEALVCLECHLIYFWIEEEEVHYALSPEAVDVLNTLFRSVEPASRGLNPTEVLDAAADSHEYRI